MLTRRQEIQGPGIIRPQSGILKGHEMIRLTRYGIREWLGGGTAALALIGAGILLTLNDHAVAGWILIIPAGAAWLAIAAFFRVPDRKIPDDPGTLVSPADGVVKDIGIVTDHGIEPFGEEPMLRIGIFLSVLDVHVNRMPADIRVTYRDYRPGRFLDARNPRCAKENESLIVAGLADIGGLDVPMAVRQVSGAIARRIVCEVRPGDSAARGDIYGMIKFGSRTELFFAADNRITPAVSIGDKVRSGATIIARMQN